MRVFCFLFPVFTVEGSASWRIPLGVQLIPGIALAIGCIFLPPSPRLLVAQGRNDEALRTLAKLRMRSEHEVQDDPLLQVRILTFCCLLPSLLCISFLFPFTFLLPHHSSVQSLSLPPLCHPDCPERRSFIYFVPYFPPTLISDRGYTIFFGLFGHGLAIWTFF